MVVIKYLFQFGFFPWNSFTTLVRYEGKPFFAPRILGLEKTDSYIKYDLIQLLVLFFHRALLLVRGVWTSPKAKPSPTTQSEEIERQWGSKATDDVGCCDGAPGCLFHFDSSAELSSAALARIPTGSFVQLGDSDHALNIFQT